MEIEDYNSLHSAEEKLELNAKLLDAASKNDVDKIVAMIRAGANPNTVDVYGCTPLMLLAAVGCVAGTKFLVNIPHCIVNKRDNTLQTALHFATLHGSLTCVSMLLDKGALVDVANDWGETPLIIASRKGFEKIVQKFLKYGADTERLDIRMSTALMYAAAAGHCNIVNLLISSDANVNRKLRTTALHEAARFGHRDCVHELLTSGADKTIRDNDGRLPVEVAIFTDKVDMVDLFLVESSSRELINNLLDVALKHNSSKVVKLLLERAADPYCLSDVGIPLFFEAIIHNSMASIVCMLQYDVDLYSFVNKRFLYNTHAASIARLLPVEYVSVTEAALLLGYKDLVFMLVSAGGAVDRMIVRAVSNMPPVNLARDTAFVEWLTSLHAGPRSLAHSCRIAIRRCLKPNFNCKTVANLDRLPLPLCMKHFIAYSYLEVFTA